MKADGGGLLSVKKTYTSHGFSQHLFGDLLNMIHVYSDWLSTLFTYTVSFLN